MTRYKFSKENIIELAANPYTYHVTENQILFTLEFRTIFWNELKKKTPPQLILEQHGYNTKIFGESRIRSIARRIKEQAESPFGLEGSAPDFRRKIPIFYERKFEDFTLEDLRALIADVKVMRQQLDFLKKIVSLKTTDKRD